jgi:hypothetical protein
MDGFARSPFIMDKQPTTRVLWQKSAATVERHLTVGDDGLSLSVRTNEVTTIATVDAPVPTAAGACAELELGAHIAQLRALVSTPTAPSRGQSLLPAVLPPGIPED